MEYYFPLILDGATGTQLQKRGYDGKICAEQWVIEHPETITEIQKKYVEAGSNIVYAPTFSANRVKLEENGLFDVVEQFNMKLVEISKKAVDGKALVAGDMAPLGKFLVPFGEMHFEEMVEVYRQQASALEKAGVDLFVVETMMSLPEARAAVCAIREVSSKPVFVSFTCDETGKTISGSDIVAVLEIMQSMDIQAFGLNCSVGPKQMVTQIARLSKIAKVPLMAKPNAGMPIMVAGKATYHCAPSAYTDYMDELASYGVGLFGGCCGSDEGHIEAIARKAKDINVVFNRNISEQIYVASEKQLFEVAKESMIGNAIACDESLAANIENCADEIITIELTDLVAFEQNQYLISKPLCLLTENEEVLEKAVRMYQGKCMYKGNIDEIVLARLSRLYGLVY